MQPILFEIFGIKIFSYPLMIGVSTGVGLTLLNILRDSKKITTQHFNLFFFGTLFFSWFGAKVFFLIFSELENTSKYVLNSNFWLGGGFVFYGGLVFATVYVLSLIFIFKKFLWSEGKYLLPILTICHGVGRIGCLLAGCCFGQETDFFISINHRHPVQLYEASLLIIFGVYFFKQIERLNTLKSLVVYLLFYSLLRFNTEFLRGDLVRGTVWGMTSSQFISIVIFIIGIGLYFFERARLRTL